MEPQNIVAQNPVMPVPIPNTSGQGSSAVVPPEIKGWSWGAFGLNWIWGVCNGTFIALLMFLPVANIIMPFVLGFKGREWAWQNKRWNSVQEFNRVQRSWGIAWGIVLLFFLCLLFFFLFVGARFATVKVTTVNSNGTVTTSNENIRQAANDARLEGMLDETRTGTENYYSQQGNYGAPTNSCTSGMFADPMGGMNALISQPQPAGFTPVCNSNGTAWAISTPLSTGNYWCVDSNARTGQVDRGQTSTPLGQAVKCPQ